MSKKGFIFDLDGVIVDTAKYHFLAWQKLAKGLGIDFNESQNEHLKGVSRKRSLEKILEWGNMTLDKDKFEVLMAKKNDDYLQYIEKMDEKEILPDVMKILNHLRNRNIPFALGSASKNARSILKEVNLLHVFNAVIDGNDVSKAKPDPEVFLIAAEKLKLEPQECIVFEDSLAGIQAANTAGMLSIGIGKKNILSEADYVFSDFTEISTNFIDELIKNESRLYKTR